MKYNLFEYQDKQKCREKKIPFIEIEKRKKYAFLSVSFTPCYKKFEKIINDPELEKQFNIRVYKVFEPTIERNKNKRYAKIDYHIGQPCSIDFILRKSTYSTARKIINIYEDLLNKKEREAGEN